MAKQHRKHLEEEVKMLESWVYYFQKNPGPSDFNRVFLDILDEYSDGVTSKDILERMKYYFPQTTISDIDTCLESLKKENLVSASKNKKAILWRLQ